MKLTFWKKDKSKSPKLGSFAASGESLEHDYGNFFFRQQSGPRERLVIGPSSDHIRIVSELARTFHEQRFFVLYVLLVSSNFELGRYQSPLFESHSALKGFLDRFKPFFEGDGRHHVWVCSPESGQTLVYDQHNVIFAYGDLNAFERILEHASFKRQEFWFPSPHYHSFDSGLTDLEVELMTKHEWYRTDLVASDEWD